MGNIDWNKVETIVDEVLELPDKKNWLEFVEKRCSGSPEVKSEVTQLLESIFDSDGWLENPDAYRADLIDASLEDSLAESRIGDKFGAYAATEIIAQGGMGAVYRGERTDGEFDHTVAIKVIKVGMDTRENIRLFNRERNILAGLNHPGIAKLFDGGVLENGAPYLIMEYVEGTPIDQYCDDHKLTIDERIDLFKDVLEAVRHAHENLIIHRDLKPDNILITEQGQVKILDFGISKLLDTKEKPDDNLNVTQARILTPRYAAPEQIRQEPVTTAADLYSLGIILHQLLTGSHPFDLENKSLHEAEHTILNSEPGLPAGHLVNHPHAMELAANRSTTARALIRFLKGDLEAILLKTIEKDPEKRYRTSVELIEEFDKYRSGLPINAQTNTLGYRFKKYYTRHKTGIAAAAGILLLVISFIIFYTWRITEERNQARLEAQKADQVTAFMTSLFDSNRPDEAQGDTLTSIQLLQNGLEQIENMEQQPEIQASLFRVIGDVYRSITHYSTAEQLLNRALEKQYEMFKADHIEIGKTIENLAQLKYDTGDFQSSDSLFSLATSIYENNYKPPHEILARGLSNHGELLEEIGNLEEAEHKHNLALEMFRQLYGDKHLQVAFVLNDLAIVYNKQGRLDESEDYYKKALDLLHETGNDRHPRVASGMHNLALIHHEKGEVETALTLMENALDLRKELFGNNHHLVASSMNGVALINRDLENYKQSEKLFREALEILKSNFGEKHLHVNYNLSNLGNVLVNQGKYEEADSLFRVALSNFTELLGEEHMVCGIVNNYMGNVSLKQGKYEESLNYYNRALSIFGQTIPPDHPRIGDTMFGFGQNYLNMNNSGEAEKYLEKALGIFEDTRGKKQQKTIDTYFALGDAFIMQKKFAQAEIHYLEGFEILADKKGIEDSKTQNALKKLIGLYEQWEKTQSMVHLKNKYEIF